MSSEETQKSTHTPKREISDDKVSFTTLSGSIAIVLEMLDEADAKKRLLRIEGIKNSPIHNESRQFNYLPPANYNVTVDGPIVKITGNVDELDDAAETLYTCLNYISKNKKEELVNEISDTRLKIQEEMRAREYQARQEKRKVLEDAKEKEKKTKIHKKYTRLAIKLGMDPNTIFSSPAKVPAEKNPSSTLTGTAIALTSKTNKAK